MRQSLYLDRKEVELGWIILALIGLFIVQYALRRLKRDCEVLQWLEVPARMIDCKVVPQEEAVGLYAKEWFVLKARYEYRWEGVVYTGCDIGLDERSSWFDDHAAAQRVLASIVSRGTCYLNATCPAQALLLNRLSDRRRWHYIAAGIGGLLCLLVAIGGGYFLGE